MNGEEDMGTNRLIFSGRLKINLKGVRVEIFEQLILKILPVHCLEKGPL